MMNSVTFLHKVCYIYMKRIRKKLSVLPENKSVHILKTKRE
jgi:hypothetical protein